MGSRRKVDAIHAWGIVTLGVGLFAGVPTVAAVVKDPGAPPDWWFFPGLVLAGSLVVLGLVLVTVPVVPTTKRADRPKPALVPKELSRQGDRLIGYYLRGPSADRVQLLQQWIGVVDAEARRLGGRRLVRRIRSGGSDLPDAAVRRREWLASLPGHRPSKPPPPPDEWLTRLPIVVAGQLRVTLAHGRTDGSTTMSLWGAHVEVTGPDGTFRNHEPGVGSGFHGGVYVAHYPQDFTTGRLKPGQYEIRWYGVSVESTFRDETVRELVASDTVVVSRQMTVERLQR